MTAQPIGRFLLDYENPDAGIGHSLGHVNSAIKICMRNQLQFAYSDAQLIKSTPDSWKWRMRQWSRIVVGRKAHESHGIGDAICRMFAFDQHTVSRARVEAMIRAKQVRVVEIPGPDITIPSNEQQDDLAYAQVEAVIRAHPGDGIAFVLPARRTGDFEYGATRAWFKQCYEQATKPPVAWPGTGQGTPGLRVALHIRRGDLLPGRQFADLAHRMLPDSWYLQVVMALRQATDAHLKLVVLSEGRDGQYCSERGEAFSWAHALAGMDCEVAERIDDDFIASFHTMAQADVLIGSRSGMTHLAGLMGEQLKLVPRMWHSYRGTPHAIELEDAIDTEALQQQLRLALPASLVGISA